MPKKKLIKVMDTSFRDGFQSVFGARVLTKDFLPAVEAARAAGVRYFESGGGARFQSLYFYCNEDAFEMMDTFRATVGPDVELQTLSRGVNVVGLDSQSSDVIELHARLFKKHGVSTIRNFDALNDVNNLIYSGKCIVDAGLHHQVVVSMMELPPGCEGAHTAEFYMGVLKKILDANIKFDSICFKDASGTSCPSKVFETIKSARKLLGEDMHIVFHSHETAGNGVVSYKAALEAGASGLDLAMSPVSGGTCQPDIMTMWHVLRGTEFDLGVDIVKIYEAEKVFQECMKDYFMPPESRAVDPSIIFSPMPGGALTANTQMMRDNGILDKFPRVIDAMSEVVRKGGFGTSVTPVSQFYFQQAFNNVMFGPWKKIAEGYGKMVLGYFGKTPVEPDAEVIKISAEQLKLEPTTKTVLEINDADPKKGLKVARQKLEENKLPVTDENLFIAATCQDKGIAFLKGEAKLMVRKNEPEKPKEIITKSTGVNVTLNGKNYAVTLDGNKAIVNGKTYDFDVAALTGAPASAPDAQTQSTGKITDVVAPLPGVLVKMNVKEGDPVSKETVLFILEAMKMETEIKSPVSGKINKIAIPQGDQVVAGQTVLTVS
ncbi:MAG: 2-oxoglutarate carboxylase large subunit [bacterium ADurb.Bin157]|nr:biotin attachment protein [Candidatus Riflebacteria bacterium]OQB49736.1 MAG: 2-oxoglutarate carboxylase large subunit [bacterium ADurb.Bin157]